MKVDLVPRLNPVRGGEVQVGNVYTTNHSGKNGMFYKIVLAVIERQDNRPWNNVVCLHVNLCGKVLGSSNQPATYMSEHQDLVGKVVGGIPTLKIRWLSERKPK